MAHNKKKVLILSDDYLPASTRNHAKMLHELALKFVEEGHDVVVLTPGCEQQRRLLTFDEIEGVVIWRFRASDIRGGGKLWRVFHEILLPLRCFVAVKMNGAASKNKFDICINYSPSIFFAPIAWLYAKKGSFIYLILRDFFPQWLVDQGILHNSSITTKFFRLIEHLNYRISDIIGVQSPANQIVFRRMYNGAADVRTLMNWSDQGPLFPGALDQKKIVRAELKIGFKKVLFFYGGNIGLAQDCSNILRLAEKFISNPNVHFLLVGQGNQFDQVREAIAQKQLSNVTLLPSVPQELYRRYLSCADVGLFSLAMSHTAHNFPGKLLGYMAEEIPILGIVNSGNDVAEFINQSGSGFVSISSDEEQFFSNASLLAHNKKKRTLMGQNAARLLKESFSVEMAYQSIHSAYIEQEFKN